MRRPCKIINLDRDLKKKLRQNGFSQIYKKMSKFAKEFKKIVLCGDG